jgi:hypothetical protein
MPSRIRAQDMADDSTMVEAAEIFADAVRTFAPYAAIKQAVGVSRVSGTETTRNILVTITGVPYARAFDTGSGIHAQKGKKEYIKISPKNKQALAIPLGRWEDFIFPARPGGKMIGYSKKTDKVLLTEVLHPGVRGTNYVQNSINKATPQIREVLGATISNGIKVYVRQIFREGLTK